MTIDAPLCEGGVVRTATATFQCTGSAHLSTGEHVRCTDPSHVKSMPTISSDYTDVLGTRIKFPHCDALILHSPGTCEFCDRHPDWQGLRSAQGIAFSNTPDDERSSHGLLPCPSTYSRPAEVRDRWPGNTATRSTS